jgi:hypothetical protein
MKISEFIKALEAIMKKEGDIHVIGTRAEVVHYTQEAPSPRVIDPHPAHQPTDEKHVILDFPTTAEIRSAEDQAKLREQYRIEHLPKDAKKKKGNT